MPLKEKFNVIVSIETMHNLPHKATGRTPDLEQEAEDHKQMIGVGLSLYGSFLLKGKAERADSLGMSSLGNWGPLGYGVVSSCLIAPLGCLLPGVYRSDGGDMTPSSLVSLYFKSVLLAESFALSKNWLALGEAERFPSQKGFLRCQNIIHRK